MKPQQYIPATLFFLAALTNFSVAALSSYDTHPGLTTLYIILGVSTTLLGSLCLLRKPKEHSS